jgi:hypothetical protein
MSWITNFVLFLFLRKTFTPWERPCNLPLNSSYSNGNRVDFSRAFLAKNVIRAF